MAITYDDFGNPRDDSLFPLTYKWGQGSGNPLAGGKGGGGNLEGYYAQGPDGNNGQPIWMPWSDTFRPRIQQNTTGEIGNVGATWAYGPPEGAPAAWTGPDESLLGGFLDSVKSSLSEPYLPAMLGFGAGALGGFSGPGDWFSGSGSAGSTSSGGGMWDWIDQLLGQTGEAGVDAASLESGFNPFGSGLNASPSFSNPSWVDDLLRQSGEYGVDPASLEGGFNPALSGGGLKVSDALKFLQGIGGAGNALGSTLGGASGGSQGSGGGLLGTAFNATPFLLALAQANAQKGDLNNVLSQIDGAGYQKAVLDPFDLQTSQGRNALTQDLGQRGVGGSSFGYDALNNYDYMRGLGRGDLASKAGLASAGLQGSLINQRNTNTNMLLGAGLNASGRLFSPQKDPFNLSALLGL